MALPASFSNNISPTGLQLDQNFAALGAMAVTHCTASGTNSITLSPLSSQPAVAAYTNQQLFDFAAAASSNGSVTLQVGSLAALPLYLIGGSQAGSGDITISTPYFIQYLSSLNSGNGGFQILSAVPSSAAVAQAPGSVKGLTIANNSGTPNTKVDITGGYTVLSTTGGTPKFLSSVSVTIDLTTTGANGMDTGARPTSGWVYCYVINNGSVTAGLATATSPTAGLPSPFPGGYSNFTYVGAMRCDGSQNLLRTKAIGRTTQYTVTPATNTANMPIIAASGVVGTGAAGGMVSQSLTTFVPATAARFFGGIATDAAGSNNAGAGPNNNFGAATSITNPIPFMFQGNATAQGIVCPINMLLESMAIFYFATSTGFALFASGWEDYYSAG